MLNIFRIRPFDKMMNEVDDELMLDHREMNSRRVSGLNQFNIGISDDSNRISKEKEIILAITCISIGILAGLLGPTFPFLSQNIPSMIWLIPVKSIGFLIGIYLSSFLFTWFNVCYLLGFSCLSLSFGVGSLPFITDFTIFCLISLILGLGLGLVYNGIDVLYNRVWNHPSVSSIRWLHLFIPLGVILSTLLLFSSTIPNDQSVLVQPNTTRIPLKEHPRPRRAISSDPTASIDQFTMPTTPDICIYSYCCVHWNNPNITFVCQENSENQSSDCHNLSSSCQPFILNTCRTNNTLCRIDQTCGNETRPDCSRESIDTNNTTTITSNTITTVTQRTTQSEVTDSPSSTITTVTQRTTQSKVTDSPSSAITTVLKTTSQILVIDGSSIVHSITSIHVVYLIVALLFFILGIFYLKLVICGERNSSSSMKNLSPLALLVARPHQIVTKPNTQSTLFSDRLSLALVLLILFFYFILSGIENSCHYLTYYFGLALHLSKTKSLFLQFCYLFGRFIDLSINYAWFSLNKPTDIVSIKFLILSRLILLFVHLCFVYLFHQFYHFLFLSIGFLLASLSSLILSWIERYFSSNEILLRMILFAIILSESIFPVILFYQMKYFVPVFLLITLSLLTIVFLIILYLSQKWQEDRSYRPISTSMETESPDHSDDEVSNFQ